MGGNDPLTDDLLGGIEAAAFDIDIETRRVSDRSSAVGLDVILGVGYPQYYPWLRTPLPGARHILWIGESLPATGETLRTQIRRRLPMGRVLGALSSTGSAMGWRSLPTDWQHPVNKRRSITTSVSTSRRVVVPAEKDSSSL